MARAWLLLSACCVLAAAIGGATVAAFSSQTTGSGSFTAAAIFPGQLQMASGSYVGNGSDDRTISGLGFQPDVVIVKAATNQIGVMRTSTMVGDLAKPLVGATSATSNLIQSLITDGFTLGTDNKVNSAGVAYYWVALKAGTQALTVGKYTGTGSARSIAGLGFAPEYVAVMSTDNKDAVNRFAGMSTTFDFEDDKGVADRITSLDANGFSVGANDRTNGGGREYHYVAFNEVPGAIKVGTYTGNGTDGRDVAGVGFKPDYVMVRANDTASNRKQAHRPLSQLGSRSSFFRSEAEYLTGIKALQTDGFKVGTDGSVNVTGVNYRYLALNHTVGGCVLSGTQTVFASDDTFIEEDKQTSTHGGENSFKVKSKPGQNRRSLVRFSLPALPSGCTLTDATLRLYAKTVEANRTLDLYRNAGPWAQATVTWATRPGTTGTPESVTLPSSSGLVDWPVTDDVQAMMSDVNYGWELRDSVEDAAGDYEQQFDSTESGNNVPRLLLTVE